MATLLWQRDIASDAEGVKNTFSGWDSCMSQAYCKWPAIVGIIIGSLILFSLLWCLFRCLCCGAECCCGCLACCNACCPSPRGGRRHNDGGYYQQPPPHPTFQPYPQYSSAPPPVYASGGAGYRGGAPAQTATFDAPGKKYNEDALPAMPSWSAAQDKHIEAGGDDMEMDRMNYPQAQQQGLLPKQDDRSPYYSPHQQHSTAGDTGNMHASPYQDYNQHHQYSQPDPRYSTAYPPTYHTSPTSTMYEPSSQQWVGNYAPSVPPSYRTGPPSIAMSPPPQGGQVARKPVQGSWRDV